MRGLAHINIKTSQLHPTKRPIKTFVNRPFARVRNAHTFLSLNFTPYNPDQIPQSIQYHIYP